MEILKTRRVPATGETPTPKVEVKPKDPTEKALEDFEARFQKGDLPDNMLEVSIVSGPIAQVLKGAGLTQSTSDALRMIDGGGVRLNGEKVNDRTLVLTPGQTVVLQVGKRKFVKVTLV